MIKQLKNPMSELYVGFKEFVSSPEFPWFYQPNSNYEGVSSKSNHGSIPYYVHSFLQKPEISGKYPTSNSNHIDPVSSLLKEIIKFNDVEFNSFLRIDVNCVHPQVNKNIQCTIPHYDHSFPHKNLLVYLTDAGGKTVVEDETFDPKEDDIIVFEGIHYYHIPLEKRRIVLVSTFI